MIKKLGLVLATTLLVGQASAAAITPTYTTFGNLAGATFGGSGIPTDPTAITTFGTGGASSPTSSITLGLTAHQRFANPPLTNDGAGRFFAGPGTNDGTPGNPGTASTWNFGFYIASSSANFSQLTEGSPSLRFKLLYDLDPGVGTDEANLGVWDLTNTISAFGLGATSVFQGSQNATFGFLCTSVAGFIAAPASCPFNASASGEYSFALVAYNSGGEVGRSAILVNVVPEPGTIALLGISLLGLTFMRRRS